MYLVTGAEDVCVCVCVSVCGGAGGGGGGGVTVTENLIHLCIQYST